MNGGFSYFNSDSRRKLNQIYWTSTEYNANYAWYVEKAGDLNYYDGFNIYKTNSFGFRPSICIDLTAL